MAQWISRLCSKCHGNAVATGDRCAPCGGTGKVFVSDKDRIAEYPGGPFLGMEPGAWKDALHEERRSDEWHLLHDVNPYD